MANISGTYQTPVGGPYFFYQISYSQTGRTATTATYRFTIGVHLQYSSSYFALPLNGVVNVNGDAKTFTIRSSGQAAWEGTAVHTYTVDVTTNGAGSGGGTLNAEFRAERTDSGTTGEITVDGTVSLSTWNTAPHWNSTTVTLKQTSSSGTTLTNTTPFPENISAIYISWPAAADSEGNTLYYTVKRYVNNTYSATVVSNTTSKSVIDNIGTGNQGKNYYYTITVSDGSLAGTNSLRSITVTKNTLTGATFSSSASILYNTASAAFTYSGASNTDGNTTFTYSISCDKVTVYNPSSTLTSVAIYRTGTLPTGTYIIFDDIKTALQESNYTGTFIFTLTTTNAYGSTKTSTVSVPVNIQTTPTAISAPLTTGTYTIGGGSFYIPAYKNITVAWQSSTDPLGGSVAYDLQIKLGNGSYTTIAANLETTAAGVALNTAITSVTDCIFKVIARTSYGTSTEAISATIQLHYYNRPTIAIASLTRNLNSVIITGNVVYNTSIPTANLSIYSLSYTSSKGSGSLTSPFTISHTGIADSDTYVVTITAQDNAGNAVGTSPTSYNVTVQSYTPLLSVRKSGVGVNGFADSTHKLFVGGNVKITGEIHDSAGLSLGQKFAALNHGNHVPNVQAANDTVFLRNDNTWQIVAPSYIGAESIASYGSNSNGTYVRFSSGLQICYHTAANVALAVTSKTVGSTVVYYSTNGTWTYPATFNEAPVGFVQGNVTGIIKEGFVSYGETTTSMQYEVNALATFSTVNILTYLAIGKWK